MFTTVPGSSINSWDSWFIFNMRKINNVIIRIIDIGHGEYIRNKAVYYIQHTCIDNVRTWASVFLRHLASTSFMFSFWPYTDSGSVPISSCTQLEATLVRRMLFIVLMTAAHISPNVFSFRVASHQCTENILL